jgi:hypothetical protein
MICPVFLENGQPILEKYLVEVYSDVYFTISLEGVKNLCQNKIIPIDIDFEDLDILEKISSEVYAQGYDKVNTYKSKRGYTLMAFSNNKSVEEQYEFLVSLEGSGVDNKFMEATDSLRLPPPFTRDYFITRVGSKLTQLTSDILDDLVLSCGFDVQIRHDVENIISLINKTNVVDFIEFLRSPQCGDLAPEVELQNYGHPNLYFKDFFSLYKDLQVYKAIDPILQQFRTNEHVASKKYLYTYVKNEKLIPGHVGDIFELYNRETGALKPSIKYLL